MNLKIPALSVIVPIYKAEKYLSRCIDSILAQTFKNFELLLIDDGSPDKSGSICDAYAQQDSRIRVFHQPNRGVSSSRNLGIEQARAEWITFIDSDDWVEIDFLEQFRLEETNPDTFVLQGFTHNYEQQPEKDFRFAYYKGCTFPLSSSNDVVRYNLLQNGYPFAKLYHREKLQQHHIRFNTAISIHEDHAFVWDYLCQTIRIRLVQSASYHYEKKVGDSLSNKSYPPSVWLAASNSLLTSLSSLQVKCNLTGSHYMKEVYTSYGLEQIMKALYQIDYSNYQSVIASAQKRISLFDHYFLAKTLRQKVVLYLLKQKWGSKPLWIFIYLSHKLFSK